MSWLHYLSIHSSITMSHSKDILMPESLQRAMAVEQEARREAMAKVAAANGERDAVVTLKEAADVMESNPIALQVSSHNSSNLYYDSLYRFIACSCAICRPSTPSATIRPKPLSFHCPLTFWAKFSSNNRI